MELLSIEFDPFVSSMVSSEGRTQGDKPYKIRMEN